MDKEITFRTKWDFRKAEIGSILKYGLSTTRQTNAMGSKLQIFTSKCLRNIVDKEDGAKCTIERDKEEGKSRKQQKEDEGTGKMKNRRGERERNPEYRRGAKTPTTKSYIENETPRYILRRNRNVIGILP